MYQDIMSPCYRILYTSCILLPIMLSYYQYYWYISRITNRYLVTLQCIHLNFIVMLVLFQDFWKILQGSFGILTYSFGRLGNLSILFKVLLDISNPLLVVMPFCLRRFGSIFFLSFVSTQKNSFEKKRKEGRKKIEKRKRIAEILGIPGIQFVIIWWKSAAFVCIQHSCVTDKIAHVALYEESIIIQNIDRRNEQFTNEFEEPWRIFGRSKESPSTR